MQALILRAKHFRNCSFVGMPISWPCPIEQAAMEQFNTIHASERIHMVVVAGKAFYHPKYGDTDYTHDFAIAEKCTDENQAIREVLLSETNDFQ